MEIKSGSAEKTRAKRRGQRPTQGGVNTQESQQTLGLIHNPDFKGALANELQTPASHTRRDTRA